jgi:hypothetical protein
MELLEPMSDELPNRWQYTVTAVHGPSGVGIAGLVGARWPGCNGGRRVDSAQGPDLVVLTPRHGRSARRVLYEVLVGIQYDVGFVTIASIVMPRKRGFPQSCLSSP